MAETTHSVCAVVVTYCPEKDALDAMLSALSKQVGLAVIVDNTDNDRGSVEIEPAIEFVRVLRPGRNIGLAAAQNLGIGHARKEGYPHVLILDQDSLPCEGMVAKLLKALEALQAECKVAAVGPRFYDLRDGQEAPFVRIGFPFNRKIWCRSGQGTIKADFLISSGSLIPLRVLDEVGEMDEGLFIDNVDLEWSFRARACGYSLYGVCAATMNHSLGDSRRPLLPFHARGVVVHGARRLYYMMRNRVLLYRRGYIPAAWVAQDVLRLCVKFFLFGVIIGPRRTHLRYMIRGLWDGCRDRSGVSDI